MQNEMRGDIKKNLLDLKYNRYLQYLNTAIILLFTYFIGIAITFITGQVDYKKGGQLLLIALISIGVISAIIILVLNFKKNLLAITKEIQDIKL